MISQQFSWLVIRANIAFDRHQNTSPAPYLLPTHPINTVAQKHQPEPLKGIFKSFLLVKMAKYNFINQNKSHQYSRPFLLISGSPLPF